MARWLKVIGTSAQRFHDNWRTEAPHLVTNATFPERGHRGYRPQVAPGDHLVYHAIGRNVSRVVAIAEVVGPVRYDSNADPGFPWVCDVRIRMKRDRVEDGVPLEELNSGERDLRKSVGQHSHIQLKEAEFARAERALT
jgi:EVE domain